MGSMTGKACMAQHPAHQGSVRGRGAYEGEGSASEKMAREGGVRGRGVRVREECE